MKGYIYKIVNTKNNCFYIGSTVNFNKRKKRHLFELRKGVHHCIFLQRAFDKYGEEFFKFECREKNVSSIDELRALEERYIGFCWNKCQLYNISKKASGGDLITYHPFYEEICKKHSIEGKLRYQNMTDEERLGLSNKMKGENNPNYGKRWSQDMRERVSAKLKEGYINNEDHPFKKLKGKTFEELYGENKAKELRENLSQIASQRTGDKNPFYGKTHSEETRKKMSEDRKGSICPTKKQVMYNGVIYDSALKCAEVLKLKMGTVAYRARNNIYGFSYVSDKNTTPKVSKKMWTRDECINVAKTCKTKSEFMRKYNGAYNYAIRHGLLDYISNQYFIELRHRWSLDEVKSIAVKYKSYTDFKQNEKRCYDSLQKHRDWVDCIKNLFNQN